MDLKVSHESVPAPAAPKTGATSSAKSSLNTKSIQPGYPAVHREAVPPSNIAQVSALQKAGTEEQTNSDAAAANPETPKLNPAPTRQSGAPSASSTIAPASLNIDSSPAGADIEIDGAFVGNTPSTVSVGRGSHQITLKKKGFMEWSKALSVTGGAIHLNAELEHESPSQ